MNSNGKLSYWWVTPSLIVVSTLVAYTPACWSGYVWDDDDYLTQNVHVQSADGLYDIWFDRFASPQYYPLVFTTFWLEHKIWGLDPIGFHLTNVVLHALNALLLYKILHRFRIPGAWVAALIFAVHPVHVESVAWISERKNVLSTFFYLLAGIAYFKFSLPRDDLKGSKRRWNWYVIALLFIRRRALFAKNRCLQPFPRPLLLVMWANSRLNFSTVIVLLPFFAIGLLMGLHTSWLEANNVGASGLDFDLSLSERTIIAGSAVLVFMHLKLLVPVNLTFYLSKMESSRVQQYRFCVPIVRNCTSNSLVACQ